MKHIIFVCLILLSIPVTSHAKKNTCDQFKKPPEYITAVLIDVSEPLDQPAQMIFKKLAQKIITESPSASRLDIYKIGNGAKDGFQPELSLCKPEKFGNWFTTGEKFYKKKMQNEFIGPALKELVDLSNEPFPGQRSPILESFFSISLKSFIDASGQENLGKVIVISDFMQHSELLSFYKQNIPMYKDFKVGSNGRSWVRNFGRVSFEAVVIPRNGASKLPVKGRDFFIDYFSDNFSCWQWRDLSSSIPLGKCK